MLARCRVLVDQKLWPDDPWLTREAIDLLDRLLRPTDVAIEFGAGRSTLWFAARLAKLTSVEDNAGWYLSVRDKLAEKGLRNVDLRHCAADFTEGQSSAYVRVLDEFPDESLDFALIDGIFRSHCAVRSVPKVKRGGLIVIDNVNCYLPSRSHSPGSRSMADGPADALWGQFAEMTGAWRRIWTSSDVWDTLILFKP
jgi:predicted O-methyltransferase YrrM